MTDSRRFLIEPCAPFRLGLAAWRCAAALTTRSTAGSAAAYRRVVSIDGGPVAISVSQNGAVDAPLFPSHSPAGR
jgi:hypothetical protein